MKYKIFAVVFFVSIFQFHSNCYASQALESSLGGGEWQEVQESTQDRTLKGIMENLTALTATTTRLETTVNCLQTALNTFATAHSMQLKCLTAIMECLGMKSPVNSEAEEFFSNLATEQKTPPNLLIQSIESLTMPDLEESEEEECQPFDLDEEKKEEEKLKRKIEELKAEIIELSKGVTPCSPYAVQKKLDDKKLELDKLKLIEMRQETF